MTNGIVFIFLLTYSIGLRAFLLSMRFQKLVHGVEDLSRQTCQPSDVFIENKNKTGRLA